MGSSEHTWRYGDDERGKPLRIPGLWFWWKSPKGETIHSFTMLTTNAAEHDLMNQLHKPTDEKRMVVILPPERYRDWLEVPVATEFLQPYPAERLEVEAAPK